MNINGYKLIVFFVFGIGYYKFFIDVVLVCMILVFGKFCWEIKSKIVIEIRVVLYKGVDDFRFLEKVFVFKVVCKFV